MSRTRLTFRHDMMRVLLCEQIFTLLSTCQHKPYCCGFNQLPKLLMSVAVAWMIQFVHSVESSCCRQTQLHSSRLFGMSVETRNMSFKGLLSAEEAVAWPCQNQQSTEKQSEGGKVPKI